MMDRFFSSDRSRNAPPRRQRPAIEVLPHRELLSSGPNLSMGGIVSGSIDKAREVDSWTFSGSTGHRIELITTSTPTQSGFHAYADVFAPSGTRVAGFWPGDNVTLDLQE